MLYIQAHERYDTREAQAAILAATDAGSTPMNARGSRAAAYRQIRTALRAAASAAHARAREWLNQKTQLLNRTGFEGLKEDLEWRVARGSDEFRLFVRQRALQATDRFTEDDPLAFANGLVHAIAAPTPLTPAPEEGPHTLLHRHARALAASAAGTRAYVSDATINARVIAAHPTVSAGVALDEAPATGVQSPTPEQLASARDRLNALDLRAESAAEAAKDAGRNRVALYERSMDED